MAGTVQLTIPQAVLVSRCCCSCTRALEHQSSAALYLSRAPFSRSVSRGVSCGVSLCLCLPLFLSFSLSFFLPLSPSLPPPPVPPKHVTWVRVRVFLTHFAANRFAASSGVGCAHVWRRVLPAHRQRHLPGQTSRSATRKRCGQTGRSITSTAPGSRRRSPTSSLAAHTAAAPAALCTNPATRTQQQSTRNPFLRRAGSHNRKQSCQLQRLS